MRVLFLCLGNICRSPMAEAIFQKMVNNAGLDASVSVDSAGTENWNVGKTAHFGTLEVLNRHGIKYRGCARQINAKDIADNLTHIVAMDDSNLRILRHRFGCRQNTHLLLDFAKDTNVTEVPDPFYSNNFDFVYNLITDGCLGLLSHLKQQLK
ncbi:MAG: low molecular weight protein-tyrosine-phosphatase [Candidatus Poribacteria bacterium]|jgi:protein-tyrosine phosphatase